MTAKIPPTGAFLLSSFCHIAYAGVDIVTAMTSERCLKPALDVILNRVERNLTWAHFGDSLLGAA